VCQDNWEVSRGRRDPAKRTHSKGERIVHRSLDNQLQQQNESPPLPSLSSSSDFLLDGRVAGQFTSSSSSSLPAKSGFDELSSKPLRPNSFINTKVQTEAPVEPDTSILRSFGKAALSRFTGLRSSISTRGAKDELPPTNLNINTLFFDRLREQELENARLDIGSDNNERLSDCTSAIEDDDSVKACVVGEHHAVLAPGSDTSGISSMATASPNDNPSQCHTSQLGETDEYASFPPYDKCTSIQCAVPKIEVSALSSKSTVESQDSSSHESVNSTATQPSDEGVYSDDSVAATSDHDQGAFVPDFQTRKRPLVTFSSDALSLTAEQLGFNDRFDVFWTRQVNFSSRIKNSGETTLCESAGTRYTCQEKVFFNKIFFQIVHLLVKHWLIKLIYMKSLVVLDSAHAS
jgi:hypothetical protein